MGSKRAVLFFSAIFFVVCPALINKTLAQRMAPRNGSIYIGVGYSKAWSFPSTIRIQQNELGNDYKLLKVRGTNTSATSISLWQLSYRIGYYYNYEQTWGVELNFDPVNYNVKQESIVRMKGTVNNVPKVDKKITFSAKNGYYYYYNGMNIVLLNLVRRVTLFKNNANSIRLDGIGKVGVGPALPHFISSLPVGPVAGPQFQLAGWNAGLEIGLRGTFFRYFYLELAGKYDFAHLKGLKIYEGTASQNLHSYEAIATVGFTFPTSKNNPLFRKEKKITTILPFYQQAKQLREGSGEDGDNDGKDSTDHNRFKEIAPFDDILEKEAEENAARELRLHPPDTFNNMDSIAAVEAQRQTDSIMVADSLNRQDSIDHINDSLGSKKERKRRKREQADSMKAVQKAMQDSLDNAAKETQVTAPDNTTSPPAADTAAAKPAEPAAEEKPNKKEEKRRAKQEKKEARRKEKEAEEEAKKKAKEEEEAKKAKEEEERSKKEEEEKAKEEAPPEPPKDGN